MGDVLIFEYSLKKPCPVLCSSLRFCVSVAGVLPCGHAAMRAVGNARHGCACSNGDEESRR